MVKECQADLMIIKSTVSEGENIGNRGGDLKLSAYIDCEGCLGALPAISVTTEKEAKDVLESLCPLLQNQEYEI